ncbi:MAG: hypothetical protein SF069_17530 [Phycisphaerae bacterium]|nr:hypothetical protein [Phycisphaerae bacterium]
MLARFAENALDRRIQIRDASAEAIFQRARASHPPSGSVEPQSWHGVFTPANGSGRRLWLASDGGFVAERYGGCGTCAISRYQEFGNARLVSEGLLEIKATCILLGKTELRGAARITAGGSPSLVDLDGLPDVLNAPQTDTASVFRIMVAGSEPLFRSGWVPEWPPIEITDDLLKYRISPPLIARVAAIERADRDPKSTLPERTWLLRVRLDAGESSGVYVGLPFWAQHDDFQRSIYGEPALRVTETNADGCWAEGRIMLMPLAKQGAPHVGMQFVSGRPGITVKARPRTPLP